MAVSADRKNKKNTRKWKGRREKQPSLLREKNLWGRSGEENETGSEGKEEKDEENQQSKLPLDTLDIVAL